MIVKKCDDCKKEIKKGGDEVVVGFGWPNHSFCRRCGKPILAFLKKRRLLSPIEKTGWGSSALFACCSFSFALHVRCAAIFRFGRVDRVRLFLSAFPGRIELSKTTTGNTELILLTLGSSRASGGFL